MIRAPASAARGFVLVAALAVVLIGAMWSATAAQRIALSTQGADALQKEARARTIAEDGLASAIYLLVTSPRAPCGLQPEGDFIADDFGAQPDNDTQCLWLNDSPVLVGESDARLQDATGLFSVRIPMDEFNQLAAPFMPQGSRFEPTDSLNDFIDQDDDPRFRGAEASEYRADRLTAPPNKWARTPYQAFDAIGWSTLARPEIANAIGLGKSTGLNLNSTTATILAATTDFPAERAEQVIEQRPTSGYNGDGDLMERMDRLVQPPPFKYLYLPGDSIRVRTAGKSPTMIEGGLTLLPATGDRLWSLDYILTAPNKVDDGTTEFRPQLTLSPDGRRRDVGGNRPEQ